MEQKQYYSEEFLRAVWASMIPHVIAGVEQYAEGWAALGPCKATAEAIVKVIRAMPCPIPQEKKP